MNATLQEKLAHLPSRPGVYQHKDANGKVLYVGKAKNLRHRVRSYFQEARPRDGRLKALLSKVEDVEVIMTDNEAEALILENNLIKKLRPRYNVNLKDDKSYPYICIKNERFPRVFPTRRLRKDGSTYIGPYTDVKNMKLMLRTIRSIFKIRTCSLNLSPEAIAAGKYQPCLEYHIKKCAAPCVGLQSQASYDDTIRQVEKLLNGHTTELIALLRGEMRRLSEQMQFEEAADLRDRIAALEKYTEKQKVVAEDGGDRDVFALTVDRSEDVACGALFKVREGKVIGRQHKYMKRVEGVPDAELMQSYLEAYYTDTTFFPDDVLLSLLPAETEPLEALLAERRGKRVSLRVPRRGDKANLVKMVQANAELLLTEWLLAQSTREQERVPHAVRALERDMNLPRTPLRIECFDVSHLGGTGNVASCVVFERGRPLKSEYRTFKIRSLVDGESDDFQAMREVVARRYAKVARDEGPWPDLVVIDGGKGQLSCAVEALQSIGVYGRFPVVGLAKRLEEVYTPRDSDPLLIPRASASLQLLQRIRNEAHRFAVAFQRKQRKKRLVHTALLNIPGVGARSAQKLLRHFGSVKRIREASVEEIQQVVGRGLGRRVAEALASRR